MFRAFSWPGNFRQLHNLLRTAVIMVDSQGLIETAHLPDDFLEDAGVSMGAAPQSTVFRDTTDLASGLASATADDQKLHDLTLLAMADMLRRHKGNVSATAKALGISRNTVYRKKEQLPPDVWR